LQLFVLDAMLCDGLGRIVHCLDGLFDEGLGRFAALVLESAPSLYANEHFHWLQASTECLRVMMDPSKHVGKFVFEKKRNQCLQIAAVMR